MLRLPALTALAASLILVLGCTGSAARPPASASSPPATPVSASATSGPAPEVPKGHVGRGAVNRALTELGPVWLLRRVLREESFDKAGKFAGWRLTGLPDEWRDVDLRPGDVVSRVNGLSLETPDEAWEAWKSVALAREIRVHLEREGAPRDVVIPIDGEPSADVVSALDRGAPPPRSVEALPQRGVVRIGGEDGDEPESY
jgi:hypothetical protein